jgi:hypothetical protein
MPGHCVAGWTVCSVTTSTLLDWWAGAPAFEAWFAQ